MTHVFVSHRGLDYTAATDVRRMAQGSPYERVYVLSTKPGGAEHIVRACSNVRVVSLGQESLISMAYHLTVESEQARVTVDGAPGVARKLLPMVGAHVARVYRPQALTTPALHAEVEDLELSHVDWLEVRSALQSETLHEMVPQAHRDKIVLDHSWSVPDEVDAEPELRDIFEGQIPLVWYGALDSAGSGFRDFARLFGHLPPEAVPVVVLQSPASPAEFDDFASNLGWSQALKRLVVFTAPTLDFLAGLLKLTSEARGFMVSTAIDSAPNPVIGYAAQLGVRIVGYENRAFDGAPWETSVSTCVQGDIVGVADVIKSA